MTTPEDFEARFAGLVDDMRTFCAENLALPADGVAWISELMSETVRGGKATRGKSAIDAYNALAPSSDIAAENEILVVAWCIETLQAAFLVADDIMDNSLTRRGKPSWFSRPHVGLRAVNDAFLLESILFHLLRRHLREDSYRAVEPVFREVLLMTTLGEALDLETVGPGRGDWTLFNMQRFAKIAELKTAYYSCYLPIACVLALVMLSSTYLFGIQYQIQDDFLDCFGDPKTLGKPVGGDIREGKCAWPLCRYIELQGSLDATHPLLRRAYGDAAAPPDAVIAMLREARVPEDFADHERAAAQQFAESIRVVSIRPDLQAVLAGVGAKIFGRRR